MTIFLDQPGRFLFFTGGGRRQDGSRVCDSDPPRGRRKRILLVSTDPASNLDEMLGVALSNRPTRFPVSTDSGPSTSIPSGQPAPTANASSRRYRELWTEGQLAELREQLAGACTVEIAAFDEFAELLAGGQASAAFDHVLFDTAPTGHTLRLLSLPRAWTSFLQSTAQGASCLGPHTGLRMQEARFAAAMGALADSARTTIVLVTRPDRAALREAERTSGELMAIGIKNQQLAINAVFEAAEQADPVAAALTERGRAALRALPPRLQGLPTLRIPLRAFNMVGLQALRALLDDRAAEALSHAVSPIARPSLPRPRPSSTRSRCPAEGS